MVGFQKLIFFPVGRTVGRLVLAILITCRVGIRDALLFPFRIAEKSPGPALDIIRIHTHLLKFVDGFIIDGSRVFVNPIQTWRHNS